MKVNSASKIKAPLLIIQGANDPRVNKNESEQIVIALRNLGTKVEYICAPDEGHGYQKPVNNMAALSRAEVFLANNLKGRAQVDNPPDVAKKLQMITVNIDTLGVKK